MRVRKGQLFSQQEMNVALKKMKGNKAASESGVIVEHLVALEGEEEGKLRNRNGKCLVDGREKEFDNMSEMNSMLAKKVVRWTRRKIGKKIEDG